VTPERWLQVKEILAGVMDIDPISRAAFLDRACTGDVALRQEVESLLAAAEDSAELPPVSITSAEQAVLATALGQQYEILRPLGHGGMGAVYLARERALDRFVAIKILRPDLAAAPEIRERFRREARIAAQLSHPGILPLHTFGEVRGIWYFVMGYVHGVTLAERLRLEGRLSSDEAHRILVELTEAVEHAHRHGVIHRDIKPANILLDEESGRAMLADFGISKIHGTGDNLTATGAVVGTPNFMSPEQALGAPDIDERSDLYSIGAVGYAMLAGREPFGDVRPQELMYSKLSKDPAPLHAIAPSVPADLAAVIMRCLARKAEVRWPSARSLREALRRAGGDPVALPEALRDLPTFAPYALLWGVAWTILAVATVRPLKDTILLLMVAAIVPIGLVLHIWNVGRHGLGKRELLRVAFWPPEWWGMWWPRPLRRPNDLWRRLPWQARVVRVLLSAIFILLPVVILVRERFSVLSESGVQPVLTTEVGLVVLAGIIMVAAFLWAMARGLSSADSVRLLFGSTAPAPGWASPSLATLMAPASGRLRQPDRDTASDYRRAIADLVPTLSEPVAVVAAEGGSIARRLVAAIEDCDREIARITQIASRPEVERLAAQLSTLERETNAKTDDQRELESLVRRQLELMRGMRVQAELVAQRRTSLFDLLRALWTQLASLSGVVDEQPAAVERLRALYLEIDRIV
jgi:hypothetical protein